MSTICVLFRLKVGKVVNPFPTTEKKRNLSFEDIFSVIGGPKVVSF
jgi:hypothetical protein